MKTILIWINVSTTSVQMLMLHVILQEEASFNHWPTKWSDQVQKVSSLNIPVVCATNLVQGTRTPSPKIGLGRNPTGICRSWCSVINTANDRKKSHTKIPFSLMFPNVGETTGPGCWDCMARRTAWGQCPPLTVVPMSDVIRREEPMHWDVPEHSEGSTYWIHILRCIHGLDHIINKKLHTAKYTHTHTLLLLLLSISYPLGSRRPPLRELSARWGAVVQTKQEVQQNELKKGNQNKLPYWWKGTHKQRKEISQTRWTVCCRSTISITCNDWKRNKINVNMMFCSTITSVRVLLRPSCTRKAPSWAGGWAPNVPQGLHKTYFHETTRSMRSKLTSLHHRRTTTGHSGPNNTANSQFQLSPRRNKLLRVWPVSFFHPGIHLFCRTPLHCYRLGIDPRARHATAEDAERTQEDGDGNKLPALVISSLNVLPRERNRLQGMKSLLPVNTQGRPWPEGQGRPVEEANKEKTRS